MSFVDASEPLDALFSNIRTLDGLSDTQKEQRWQAARERWNRDKQFLETVHSTLANHSNLKRTGRQAIEGLNIRVKSPLAEQKKELKLKSKGELIRIIFNMTDHPWIPHWVEFSNAYEALMNCAWARMLYPVQAGAEMQKIYRLEDAAKALGDNPLYSNVETEEAKTMLTCANRKRQLQLWEEELKKQKLRDDTTKDEEMELSDDDEMK